MDANVMTTLITNVGFAAFAYIWLFQWMKEKEKTTNETLAKLTDVINNNTLAIQHLSDTKGVDKHAGNEQPED